MDSPYDLLIMAGWCCLEFRRYSCQKGNETLFDFGFKSGTIDCDIVT